EIHNRITVADSFDDVVSALGNIKKLNMELHVNTVVNRQNMADLKRTADLLSSFAPLNHKLSLVEPSGFFEGNRDSLLERPSVLAGYAKETVSYGVGRHSAGGMTFGLEGFSLCHIRGFERYVDNLFTHGIEYMSEAYEGEFFPVDHGPRIYPEKCLGCALRESCPGVYKGFVETYGDEDIFPLDRSKRL
ncbi:MAG: hypothetical protein FJ088_07025, partial [Deltaproteobacteria bacterium]|nr:hypothetical protein [Deltaproteobacteria bacterium]